ncbi:2,3-bisphosphoglycerate-independent phosphoglycerate mutase [Nanohaloarchaea archaeon H01]|nr:2,3-bisphosphoglycerate-independent phosphoglycerate mutase [Nanohaloarchaea archaeon H01]
MKPVLLVVIDGLGLREEKGGNAFRQAETPNLDKLMEDRYAELQASEEAVGLPEGYTGNSEVGHLHLGAGRRIPQRLKRINDAIENGELREKEALKKSLGRAERDDKAVHLAGIISDGGIHGHIDHLKALIDITQEYDTGKVWIHCFTDGRDVAPKSAEKFLSEIEEKIEGIDVEIATVMGRYYAMDRDHNWDRTHKAYQAMAKAEGFKFDQPEEAMARCYDEGDYDYFIQPSVSENYEGMNDEDELIFYNFRADRERQIVEAFLKIDFNEFEAEIKPNFVSMLRYRQDFDNPVLFQKKIVENTLGEKIEEAGLSQLRVAESQKKPHVTYFFNGQRELEFEHEDCHFVESDKIKAYNQKPEMHADDIADVVLKALDKGEKDFILLNFANCDLVGHTGEMGATKKAVETVDRNIGRLVEKVNKTEYAALITADHGNCEDMGTGKKPNTSHTTNPVPLIGIDTDKELKDGELWEVENLLEEIIGI